MKFQRKKKKRGVTEKNFQRNKMKIHGELIILMVETNRMKFVGEVIKRNKNKMGQNNPQNGFLHKKKKINRIIISMKKILITFNKQKIFGKKINDI